MANQQPHRRFKRETMSSRWMPGQKLAIVRKSDRLKSEGDFEGDRQLEEWSPADRFSDSTFYSRLVFSVNCFVTQISEFMRKTFQAAQLTHEIFLTIDHSSKIVIYGEKSLMCCSLKRFPHKFTTHLHSNPMPKA